jgi:hypothetical protein
MSYLMNHLYVPKKMYDLFKNYNFKYKKNTYKIYLEPFLFIN